MLKNYLKGFSIAPRLLFNQTSFDFAAVRSKYLEGIEHVADPVMDAYAKRFRKIILDRSILAKDKLVVPVVRLRQEEDTLEKLRANHLCAGKMRIKS
jgi:hypothetical protein